MSGEKVQKSDIFFTKKILAVNANVHLSPRQRDLSLMIISFTILFFSTRTHTRTHARTHTSQAHTRAYEHTHL